MLMTLDRVLVKDRLESKLRLHAYLKDTAKGWIGSWSKIGLRANSDLGHGQKKPEEVGSGPGQRSA